ncbi:MAG: PAS domain-containing protein [Deltaproteobacteria bacterium]|nr:PAS domain-containing protein [Deltaproteobacteria bacterium]
MFEDIVHKARLSRFVELIESTFDVRLQVCDAAGTAVVGTLQTPAATLAAQAPVVVGLITAGRVLAYSDKPVDPRLQGFLEALSDLTAALAAFSAEAGAKSIEVARTEERLRLALEATTDAIWDWDLTTNKTYYSPRWYQMLGYEPGAFPSSFESWAAMTDPQDVERTVAVVNAAVARGEGYHSEFRMRHADGGWRVIVGRGRVSARDASGKPIRMSGTNTDVTSQREAERERLRLEGALRQREKLSAIGQLAGGVAHDFNNQLTTVLGSAELLMESVNNPQDRELVQDILAAASRSAELTRKLLSFSRQGQVQRSEIDVHALINEVVAMLRRSIDRRIRLETDLRAAYHVVKGDSAELQNAILNLALNARDAMSDGGQLTFKTHNIFFGANDHDQLPDLVEDQYLVVGVADTGHGMSPEVQARLFEPFFTTKPAGVGTGMGLASVYGTVKAHQGAVRVTTALGKGSEFAVYLPVIDTSTAVRVRRTSDLPQIPACRVLVVDDEPLVREQFARSLRSLGHLAEVASGGGIGVARLLASENAFDVAIVDVSMPDMSGRETIAAMRKVAPQLRFIVTSGFAVQGEVQATLDEGARAFIPKPFFRSTLAHALAEALL